VTYSVLIVRAASAQVERVHRGGSNGVISMTSALNRQFKRECLLAGADVRDRTLQRQAYDCTRFSMPIDMWIDRFSNRFRSAPGGATPVRFDVGVDY
jgi:hypothetical protein